MRKRPYSVTLTAIPGIPLIKKGDDIGKIIVKGIECAGLNLQNKDIFVVASKIVSKAEGRQISLKSIKPSAQAVKISKISGKDPRIVEVMMQEGEIIEVRPGVIETFHSLGFICTNAGVDKSNSGPPDEEQITLLPTNPDQSARKIQRRIEEITGKQVGIVINDSLGMKYRYGSIGLAIGVANIPALLVGEKSEKDLYGKQRNIRISLADEVAAAGSLLMGQGDAGFPVVLVKGLVYPKGDGVLADLIETEQIRNDIRNKRKGALQ